MREVSESRCNFGVSTYTASQSAFRLAASPRRVTHERRAFRAGANTRDQPFTRLPDPADRLVRAILAHLRIDTIRRAAQRKLTQRDQIALAKEIANGVLGLLRHIHLAIAHAVEQLFRGKIDERDFVGEIEDAIGHGLPDPNTGDLPDDIVETFQMLDVDGRVDVYTRVE